jgi:hypothetical protein
VPFGPLVVQALDLYDNPVANVPLTFQAPTTAPGPPAAGTPHCPAYVPTQLNTAEASGTRVSSLTGTDGAAAVGLVAAKGTLEDIITITAPALPALTYHYRLDKACGDQEELVPYVVGLTGLYGQNLNAALVSETSPYPVSLILRRGSPETGYHLIEASGGVQVQVSPGTATFNPMRYGGAGKYETFVTTGAVSVYNAVDATIADGDITRSQALYGVTGIKAEITDVVSLGVPEGASNQVIYLEPTADNHFRNRL